MTKQYLDPATKKWHDVGTGPHWRMPLWELDPDYLRDKPTPESTPETMTQPEPTIPNRDHQHGGIEAVGETSQSLKQTMRLSPNWRKLTNGEREALDLVAHKIARILSGADPHDSQHWEDVAGYPMAVLRERAK